MTDTNFDPSQHPRGDAGKFTIKEGEAPVVVLAALTSTNDFRHAEDIPQLIEDYEVLTSPENLYSDGEVPGNIAESRFQRLSAHAINRAAELTDDESADETVGFVHQLAFQAGRPADARGANYGKFLAVGDQRRIRYFEGGSPVVTVAADRAIVLAGSENGSVTVQRGVNADIFVAEDAQVNIRFEDGASGRVISASPRTIVHGTPGVEVVGNQSA